MVIAVARGDDKTVDFTLRVSEAVKDRRAEFFPKLFCRLALVALYSDHLNVGILFPLLDKS